ncbi:MAG: sialate O-acetylesterase [Deltaproteobacteria bacterium]|nr:MAG: sialate O-acetylesterase [Deltaproteobacteria bacterium]
MAQAHVRLPSVFSDRMVLQRHQPVPVWGWAHPGERVTVKMGLQSVHTIANSRGRWRVTLAPFRGGASYTLTVSGHRRIVLRDVVVGEVWLCSGQSNMQWPLRMTYKGAAAIAKSNNTMLRLMRVPVSRTRGPQGQWRGTWQYAQPVSTRYFSAACYHAGLRLQKKLGVPVGLLQSGVGGTRVEAWTPLVALKANPRLRWVLQGFQRPSFNSPSVLFNSMIAPLVPFAVRGVFWYQGESNLAWAEQYQTAFSTMIRAWRRQWKQKKLPFVFVQIAPFRYGGMAPDRYNKLCEAQVAVWKNVPNTAMVSTHDIGDLRDIHPRNKSEVGRRLFLAAMNRVYNDKKAVFSGPIYQSMTRKGKRLLLRFSHTHGGLVIRGKQLKHMQVAGPNRVFVPAKARIVGASLEVWSPKVPRPVAARLAWRDDAIHNLFNGAGFPASTFRTDRW